MPGKIILCQVLLLSLTIAPCAEAFVFDSWKSGMNISQVIETGKVKGLSVALDSQGVSFFGQSEPEEMAVKVEYHAVTKLMGYDAKIHFIFMPESRLLHTLQVTVNLPLAAEKADMEILADVIAKQIGSKYKEQGEPPTEGLFGQLIDKARDIKRRAWKGQGDTVLMETNWKMMGGEVTIRYLDEKLAEKAVKEDRHLRMKRLERSSGEDRNKF